MEKKEFLSLREVQLAEFDILCQAVDYFEKHGIEYFLCGGTLLGAIRHNGFIPWDDDIDIFVPREDYEKLKILVRKGDNLSGSMTFRLPGDVGYQFPFVKASNKKYPFDDINNYEDNLQQYLWVDVFPLNHYPDGKFSHRIYVMKLRLLSKITQYGALKIKKRISKSVLLILVAKVISFIMGGYRNVSIVADKLGKRLNDKYRNSNHVGNGMWPNKMKDYFPAGYFTGLVKHEFEGKQFHIPKEYDAYLTDFYGDYMTLPPADKRQTHYVQVYKSKDTD